MATQKAAGASRVARAAVRVEAWTAAGAAAAAVAAAAAHLEAWEGDHLGLERVAGEAGVAPGVVVGQGAGASLMAGHEGLYAGVVVLRSAAAAAAAVYCAVLAVDEGSGNGGVVVVVVVVAYGWR